MQNEVNSFLIVIHSISLSFSFSSARNQFINIFACLFICNFSFLWPKFSFCHFWRAFRLDFGVLATWNVPRIRFRLRSTWENICSSPFLLKLFTHAIFLFKFQFYFYILLLYCVLHAVRWYWTSTYKENAVKAIVKTGSQPNDMRGSCIDFQCVQLIYGVINWISFKIDYSFNKL